MKRLQYKCTLLTEVVLIARAATEGSHQSLDYIPGAKFLGIVAGQCYDENQQNQTLDLFHNGVVRFGDAHPLYNGERLLKVPLNWHYPKGRADKSTVYLYHHLDRKKKNELIDQNIKLEQARGSYFSTTYQSLNVKQNFSIKSAYDSEKRRAEDQKMYGYFGLDKGTEWSFTVETDKVEYAELIDNALLGKHRIGRSKTAEYGMIRITKSNVEIRAPRKIEKGLTYIYATSNLCFYNQYGQCTLTPEVAHLNCSAIKRIFWDKSQIRSRPYQTWNQHRRNRDADRLIIEKGSVIAIELDHEIDHSVFDGGIGAHRSEGFGNVIVDPDFLKSEDEKLIHEVTEIGAQAISKKGRIFTVQKGGKDDLVHSYLKLKEKAVKEDYDISQQVNDFIKTHLSIYSTISNSQWGQIRKYAKGTNDVEALRLLIFDESIGFIHRGQTEEIWREKRRGEILETYLFEDKKVSEHSIIEFMIKLSSEMAKRKND